MKDRETRGAEAGGSEDKRLLWTETAENTETRRVPSTKVPAPRMIALSKDLQEIYSVLRGNEGRHKYECAEKVPDIIYHDCDSCDN